MAAIYVSFSSHIAKVLRKEYAKNGMPIDIPAYISSSSYWRWRYPTITMVELRKKQTLREIFLDSLIFKEEKKRDVYIKAWSEEEYRQFPDSEEKRDELVAFQLPKMLDHGVPTSTKTTMERYAGQRFRQACIFHVYDILSKFLHKAEFDSMQAKKAFKLSEGIRMFADAYDLSANEQNTFLTQYYRRKIK